MTNEELIARHRAGDRDALLMLYKQNRGMIHQMIRRFSTACELNIAVSPDDLQSESFLALVDAVDSWQADAGMSFCGWYRWRLIASFRRALGLVTGHVRADLYKRSSGNVEVGEDGETELFDLMRDPDTDPTDPARQDRSDKRRDLDAAIARLPDDEARAVHLRYLDELPPDAVAARLGVDRHRATRATQRALKRLRDDWRLRDAYAPACFRIKSLASWRTDHTSAVELAAERRDEWRERQMALLLQIAEQYRAQQAATATRAATSTASRA